MKTKNKSPRFFKSANTSFLLFSFLLLLSFNVCSSPKILLTNDDGIESEELEILANELRKNFEVIVSAPRHNQSGSSQATTSRKPLVVERIYKEGTFFGYGVDGRPADAVTFGIMELGKDTPFDLVVSGINRGANVGNVSHLSGTVGAAMQAQYLGYPSIATSQSSNANTNLTTSITIDVINKMIAEGMPKGTVISINVPSGTPKGIKYKTMGGSFIGSTPLKIIAQDEAKNTITYQSSIMLTPKETKDNDTKAYQDGYVTITPLRFDWTDNARLKELKKWDLKLPK